MYLWVPVLWETWVVVCGLGVLVLVELPPARAEGPQRGACWGSALLASDLRVPRSAGHPDPWRTLCT